MLLLDLDYYKLQNYRILWGDSLTAVSLLIAKAWKLQEVLKFEECVDKMRLICLMSKLTVMCKKLGRLCHTLCAIGSLLLGPSL